MSTLRHDALVAEALRPMFLRRLLTQMDPNDAKRLLAQGMKGKWRFNGERRYHHSVNGARILKRYRSLSW